MTVQNESYNLYLRAIADPSGFTQFSAALIKEMRAAGAVTEVETRKINALTASVASGAITAAAGMRQLSAAINGINPARLQALSNLGFDRAGLAQTTAQLTRISALLSEIQAKSNGIVRTTAGLVPSTRVAAALGGAAPVQIQRTGTSGNTGIYQITSQLGTSIARGQKEAQALGNRVLIAELSKLRVAMLAQASTNPAVVSGLATSRVLPSAELRANTSAITANTAATVRDTAAINRLTAAVERNAVVTQRAVGSGGGLLAIGGAPPRGGPPGAFPSRPVNPSGPFNPPSGAPSYSTFTGLATGLASTLNRLYGSGRPTGPTHRAVSPPPSAFAADTRGITTPLGAYTPNVPALMAVVAARKEIAAIDALEASRSSARGPSRAEAQRQTVAANEAIINERLSRNPIVDSLDPYLGVAARTTLLNTGVIRGHDAARIPEEGLLALGMSPDRAWWRQQGPASTPVPGLGNYRNYAIGSGGAQLDFSEVDRRAQLQRTVNAGENGPLVQRLAQNQLDQQKFAAQQASNLAAIKRVANAPPPVGQISGRFPAGPSFFPPTPAERFLRSLPSYQEFDPRTQSYLHGTSLDRVPSIAAGGFADSGRSGAYGPGYPYTFVGDPKQISGPAPHGAAYDRARQYAQSNAGIIQATPAPGARGVSLSETDFRALGEEFKRALKAPRAQDAATSVLRDAGYDIARITDSFLGTPVGVGLRPGALIPSAVGGSLTDPDAGYQFRPLGPASPTAQIPATSRATPIPAVPAGIDPFGRDPFGPVSAIAPPAFLSSPAFQEAQAAVGAVRDARAVAAKAEATNLRALQNSYTLAAAGTNNRAAASGILGSSILRTGTPDYDAARTRYLQGAPNAKPETVNKFIAGEEAAIRARIAAAKASVRATTGLTAAERQLTAYLLRRTALAARQPALPPPLNAATAVTLPGARALPGGVPYNPRVLTPGLFVAGPGGVLPPGRGSPPPPGGRRSGWGYPGPPGYHIPSQNSGVPFGSRRWPPPYPGPAGYYGLPVRAITAGPTPQVVPPGRGPTGPAAPPVGGVYTVHRGTFTTVPPTPPPPPPRFPGSPGGGIPGGGAFFGGAGGGGGGGGGGFFKEFGAGFRGLAEKSAAFQIGQVAKFSLLYGTAYAVLFSVASGLKAVITQAIEFQQSLSSLSIVTGQSKEDLSGFASELGKTATEYGIAPGVGVEAGAKAIGIFGLNELPEEVRNYQSKQVAEIATAQQFLAGTSPEETIQNLGAIGGAYELDPAGLQRVADLDAFFTRELGTGVGTTLQTLAQTGTLAQSAGFSLEEAQVLAGVVRQRTGQTPAAAAGLLSQFYGRSGDPELRTQISGLGIDVTGTTFAEQIKELAVIGLDDPQARNLLENAFGKGRGKGAVGNVIQELGTSGQATLLLERAAEGEASGAQEKALNEKLGNLRGQIDQFLGGLLDLSVNLGKSGLLEAFGAVVFVLDNFVDLLNNLLGPFSQLPGAIRLAVIGLTAFAVAARTGVAGSIAGRIATKSGFTGAANTGVIRGAFSTVGPLAAVVAAIGLLDTFGQMNTNMNEYRQAIEDGDNALASNLRIFAADGIASATTLEGVASASQTEIDDIKKELYDKSTFLGIQLPGTAPVDLFGTATADKKILGLEANIALATANAAISRRAENQVLAEAGAAVFVDPTNLSSVSETLEILTGSGVSATESMRLLAQALFGVSEEGEKTRFEIDRRKLGGEVAEKLANERDFFGPERVPVDYQPDDYAFGFNARTGEFSPRRAFTGDEGNTFNQFLDGEFGALPFVDYSPERTTKPNPAFDLFQENAVGISDTIFSSLPDTVGKGGLTAGEYEKVADNVVAYLTESGVADAESRREDILLLLEIIIGEFGLGKPGGKDGLFNTQELFGAVSGIQTVLDKNLAALVPGDFTGIEKKVRKAIREIQRALSQAAPDADPTTSLEVLAQVRYNLITQKIEENERLLRAAQQGKSDAEIARLGNQFGRRNLRLAARSGSVETIIGVMTQMNRYAVNQVRATLKAALDAAKAALERRQALFDLLSSITLRRSAPGSASAGAKDRLQEQRGIVNDQISNLDDFDTALEQTVFEDTYAYPDGAEAAAEADDGPTQAQIDAAKAIAEATRRAGQVPLATAQLQSARADLAAAEEGTVEYYQALAGVYEAQRSLAEAIREQNINKFLLANDITDPVVEARAELKRAKRTLAYSQRNDASPDQIEADRLEVRRQEANLQSTKFSQWFSDLQTAESLERISNAKYIRLLERRSDHLSAIKNRTRQQQDQFDEVEQALKAARETLSGQFNIGDIKVPTPYDVRRSIEVAKANAVNNATLGNNVPRSGVESGVNDSPRATVRYDTAKTTNYETKNDIKIDGADTAQIIRILRDILGNNAIKSTATKTGKR